MNEQYEPQKIESDVQQYWKEHKTFSSSENSNKEKFYCLAMFPYPSGNLHMGHVRNYTISDVIARFQRLKGKNVMHPFGWDAFGLPAENAAIKHKTAPHTWTKKNIAHMKDQLKLLGFSFDWDREFATCDPEYYKWEQKFFNILYKKGLVYKKTSSVNWCPNDKTVLANEQVESGLCWRCDTPVVQKDIPLWFIKITDYADELLNDLDNLPGWPDTVKRMQKNWIGRSEGLALNFNISEKEDKLQVYTTRPETIMGVTYLAIAPTHPLALEAARENNKLSEFIEECKKTKLSEADMSTAEKKGFQTQYNAIHPISGKQLPIYIANFVLMEYGTGAVMSVPAHDSRDFDFAAKYGIDIKQVIKPIKELDYKLPYTEPGVLINSDIFNGQTTKEAAITIIDYCEKNDLGKKKVNYRLRDWGVSRQRYWGTPIPMATDKNGKTITIPDSDLPVTLPTDVEMDGITNPLQMDEVWKNVKINGKNLIRETDTFDTFMESSWYYARFCSPNASDIVDPDKSTYWLPVDQYVGGIEHAVMHLLYSRFFHKLLRDEGYVKCDEPYKKLLCQGMVLSEAYYYVDENGSKQWVNPNNVNKESNGETYNYFCKDTNNQLIQTGMTKMSKSKNNGVDPKDMVEKYGADTARLFTMFAAPAEMTLEWKESGVEGANRFLKKLWKFSFEHISNYKNEKLNHSVLTQNQTKLRRLLHKTIMKVSDDIERRQTFNTAIASIMEFMNHLYKFEVRDSNDKAIVQESLASVIIMLYPITPHICFTLWGHLGQKDGIDHVSWPIADQEAMKDQEKLIVVQVNGKVRAKLTFSSVASQDEIEKVALSDDNVSKFILNKQIKKKIYIKDKILNIVAI